MVRFEQAEVRRAGRTILGPLDLALPDVGLLNIVGRNGSGKSTLLRLLHGLERVRRGRVVWDVAPDRAMESFVFQTPVMLRRTVLENLELPLRLRGLPTAPAPKIAEEFELTDYLKSPATQLSGGEQQRVALARALVTNPQRLFLDEPTANLDRATTKVVEGKLLNLVDQGRQVILSTHSVRQLERLGGQVVFVDNGGVLGPVATADFLQSPMSEAANDWITGE